jgi:hypothetical protein
VRSLRAAVALSLMALVVSGCGAGPNPSVPFCPGTGRDTGAVILIAQAVPSAAFVPCLSELPAGWTYGGERLRNGRPEFWLDSDRAGFRALTVSLTPTCDVSKAVEVPSETGALELRRYEEPDALPPAFFGNRYYVFPGGCITYRFTFHRGGTYTQVVEATGALSFVDRAEGVRELAKEGVTLCGRGATCPG